MSELQVNPQVVINDLQNKLSDAEMRETFAKAQVAALQEHIEKLTKEAQAEIRLRDERIEQLETSPQVVEGEVE